MTHKLHYVEDYIQFIAGVVDRNLNITFFGSTPISLARYDVKIVESLALQASDNISFTDKQAALAQRLVGKYKKQFAKLNIDVTQVEINAEFKNGIRVVDREQSLTIVNDKLVLKFPYNKDIIEQVVAVSKEHYGDLYFHHDTKTWVASVNEYNVSSLFAIAKSNNFTISEEVDNLMNRIIEVEQSEYKIELNWDFETDKVYITNAEPSLLDYIENNLGGLSSSNFDTLVDCSSHLGYTVSEEISRRLNAHHGNVNVEIMKNRFVHLVNSNEVSKKEALTKIYNYAVLANRWPVYMYNSGIDFESCIAEVFGEKNIIGPNKHLSDYTGKVVMLKTSLRRTWDKPIPLLVTTNMLVANSMRHQLALYAEKIVYYTPSTYNETDYNIRKIVL